VRLIRIPKGKGRYRTVAAPDREQKTALRALLPALIERMERTCDMSVVHGFARERSPVTNAEAHVGPWRYTVTMDLQGFFDRVRPHHVPDAPAAVWADIGAGPCAAQGLPTSPAIANIAAAAMDRDILAAIQSIGSRMVYTRYADDLSFSCRTEQERDWLLDMIPRIVERHGHRIAQHKTHVYDARAGRRIITGVAVDAHGVHPTRKMRRRLRAAQHQRRLDSAAGLREWCACRRPALRRAQSELSGLMDRIVDACATGALDPEAVDAEFRRIQRLAALGSDPARGPEQRQALERAIDLARNIEANSCHQ